MCYKHFQDSYSQWLVLLWVNTAVFPLLVMECRDEYLSLFFFLPPGCFGHDFMGIQRLLGRNICTLRTAHTFFRSRCLSASFTPSELLPLFSCLHLFPSPSSPNRGFRIVHAMILIFSFLNPYRLFKLRILYNLFTHKYNLFINIQNLVVLA